MMFARKEWTSYDTENGGHGKFMYLKNILVQDGPVEETNSLLSWRDIYEGESSARFNQWWKDHAEVLNRKLYGTMKIFAQEMNDDSDEGGGDGGDGDGIGDSDGYGPRKRFRFAQETEVLVLGLTPSGSTVLWRVKNYRPYFFIRKTDDDSVDIKKVVERAMGVGKCEFRDHLAPQFLEFDPDPEDPSRAKKQTWIRVSFPTRKIKRDAIQICLNNKMYLAEHLVDEEQMFMKTHQWDVDAWYFCDKVSPSSKRASTCDFEMFIENQQSISRIRDKHQELVDIPDTSNAVGLVFDRKNNFVKTILCSDLPKKPEVLTSSDFIPPHVVGAYDIEVAGEIGHPDLFPDPLKVQHSAYIVCASFAFTGSVPKYWKEKGIQVGVPFFNLALICKPCPAITESEAPNTHTEVVYNPRMDPIHNERQMYDRWRDWMFGIMDVDISMHFNGFMFDQPYVWTRITGLKSAAETDSTVTLSSRYPWMSRLWSFPARAYWKELKQKKRNKNTPSAMAKTQTAAVDDDDGSDDEDEDDEETNDKYQLIWKAAGVADVDLLRYVREFYRNETEYKLDHLAIKYLKDKKHDVHHYEITKAYHSDSDEDRKRILLYCVQDCALTIRLFQKFLCFEQLRAIGQVTITPISTLITVGQQKRLLNMFLHFSTDFGYVMNGIKDNKYAVKTSYAGGLVQDPVPGLHYGLAAVDFASLYPSIMRAYGLCYTTFISDEKWEEIQRNFPEDVIREKMKVDTHEPRPGVKYRFAQCFMSVLCKVLEILVNRRKVARLVEEDAQEKGNKEVELVYNKLQLAIKVVCNSVYGFTGVGVDKGPIMGNQAISETTTFRGQRMISSCRVWLESGEFASFLEENPKWLEKKSLSLDVPRRISCAIKYGDTDSLFFNVGDSFSLDEIYRIGSLAAEYITQRFQKMVVTTWTNPIKLELEKVFGAFLCIRKKCYAGICIEKIPDCIKFENGEKAGKLLVRGLKAVRRDTFGVLKTTSFGIMNSLLFYKKFEDDGGKTSRFEFLESLKRENVEKALVFIRTGIDTILENKAKIDDFVVTGELQLSYSSDMACPPHAAVGWKMKYLVGERVPYALVKTPNLAQLTSVENKYIPKEIKKKPGRWNLKDFLKPPDLMYPVAAYARHPTEIKSVAEINKLHYMKLLRKTCEKFFVAGVHGNDRVLEMFRDAFHKIYLEESGNQTLDAFFSEEISSSSSTKVGVFSFLMNRKK